MGPGVLEDCTNCHNAHDFRVSTTNCLNCHKGIFSDSTGASLPPPPGGVAEGAAGPVVQGFQGIGAPPAGDSWWLHPSGVVTARQQAPRFLHSNHRNVQCVKCHDSSRSHGALKVSSIKDCRGCHHTDGLGTQCSRCHQAPGGGAQPAYTVERTLTLSVRKPVDRTMPFDHRKHTSEQCSTCHTQGLELSAAKVDCDQCHEQHHALDNDCTSCHRSPPVRAHPVTQAHTTCAGSGCHANPPFQALPTTTREVCLVCHQQQKDHKPGRICADCHALSEPRN